MNHQVQINLSEWGQTKDVSKEIIGLPKKYNIKMYSLEYKTWNNKNNIRYIEEDIDETDE